MNGLIIIRGRRFWRKDKSSDLDAQIPEEQMTPSPCPALLSDGHTLQMV